MNPWDNIIQKDGEALLQSVRKHLYELGMKPGERCGLHVDGGKLVIYPLGEIGRV